MKEKWKVLFFCMIFAVKGAFGQYSASLQGTIPANNRNAIPGTNRNAIPGTSIKKNYNPAFQIELIPAYFSTTRLGFFCRQEWKFESTTKLPFKFRLGNIQYCDWLEGKKGAVLIPTVY